jgi:hypothetical protein
MRRCLSLGAMLLLVAGAAPALCQILDSDPDVVGLYVDPIGNLPGICEVFAPTTVYLMITHPSDTSGLTSFQCGLGLPSNVALLGISFYDAVNLGVSPQIVLGYPTPRPVSGEAYTLGTLTVMTTNGTPSTVRLLPPAWPGPLATYGTVDGAGPIGVHPPDWSNGMPGIDASTILWLNHPEWCLRTVPAENNAWGAVKALYR